MELNIQSSATLNIAENFPQRTMDPPTTVLVYKATVVAGEVHTVDHFEDELFFREVLVVNASTGARVTPTLTYPSTERTVITFPSAGTFNVKIEK